MFQFNPARTIAALGLLSQAVVVLLALVFVWTAPLILAVEGVSTAALGVFGTLFVENRSVSIAGLEALQNLSPAELEKLDPKD